MRAIILAAGSGRRLGSIAGGKPKCLLEIEGHTLLENMVMSLLDNDIDQVTVVVGYRHELVVDMLKKYPLHLDIVVNRDYAQTNTIASLYLARDYLYDGFLYFNADILFDRQIVTNLLAHSGSVLAVHEKACGSEEVKVITNDENRVVRIGKSLPLKKCFGEFIGICKFAKSACQAMVDSLYRYNEILDARNLFFECALDSILAEHTFQAMSIDNLPAIEIDTPEDYASAMELWQNRNR